MMTNMHINTGRVPRRCLLAITYFVLLATTGVVGVIAQAQSVFSKNIDVIRNSVVYLHVHGADGQLREVGTGFLMIVPTKADPKLGYYLLITARHMVDPKWMGCNETSTSVSIVLNTKTYDPTKDATGVIEAFLTTNPGMASWSYPEDQTADVAVTALDGKTMEKIPKANQPLRISELATAEEMQHVNSGDPVVSAGLLDGASGTRRNQPIFKFGNVSSIPEEKIGVACCPSCGTKFLTEWMIAASLVPGNSGSPIYYMPNGFVDPGAYNKRPFLMGVQSSSFTGSDVAGMTPATFISNAIRKMNLSDADIPQGTSTAPAVATPSSDQLNNGVKARPLPNPN